MSSEATTCQDTIRDNFTLLSECTSITLELVIRLLEDNLITHSESEFLKNPATPNFERASYLYDRITKKFGDSDFMKFKEALKLSGCQKAFKILNTANTKWSSYEQETISGAGKLLTIEQAMQTWNLNLKEEIKRLTEMLRAEFKADVAVIDGKLKAVTEVTLLQEKLDGFIEYTENKMKLRADETEEVRGLLTNLESNTSSRISNLEETSKKTNLETNEEHLTLKRKLDEIERTGEKRATKSAKLESVVETLELATGEATRQLQIIQTKQNELDEQVGKLKLVTEDSIKHLRTAVDDLETSLVKSDEPWLLESNNTFSIDKVMGMWYPIERFDRASHCPAYAKLEEFIFTLAGDTVQQTHRYQWKSSSKKELEMYYYTVDTESPQYWTESSGSCGRIWVKTDYENYGMIMRCDNKDISSGVYLYILSRKRNIPQKTLESLRNFAVKCGFPKANGELIDQVS